MKNWEKRISFGKVSVKGGKSGKYFSLSVRIALNGKMSNGKIKMSRPTFTAMASVGARFAGQCLDDVVCNDPLFVAIRRLWKAYHLNDMRSIPKDDIKIIRRILAAKGNTSEEIKSEFLAEVIH